LPLVLLVVGEVDIFERYQADAEEAGDENRVEVNGKCEDAWLSWLLELVGRWTDSFVHVVV
jgi:hypothetical protein